MFTKRLTYLIISCNLLLIAAPKALAETQDTPPPSKLTQALEQQQQDLGLEHTLDQVDKDVDTITNKASGLIDKVSNTINSITGEINSIFGRIDGIFNGDFLGGLVKEVKGKLGIPDPENIIEQIQKVATPQSAPLDEQLGSRTGGDGSPVIKGDLQDSFLEKLDTQVAEQTSLDSQAQQQSAQRIQQLISDQNNSAALAADSQGQDVTQRIMQNISQQLAENEQTNTYLALEASQAQVEQALELETQAQALKQLNSNNLANRRQRAAASEDVYAQGALITLPGSSGGALTRKTGTLGN